ncbi:hypothetical protein NE237_008339 [Protea cynaroides]|uniref:Uncharacterized protein n=1 Tax=Protea cynaroides TaxID=273540 RepID=A0A9Q0KWK0_9MAGN|nr:hypothetical protein NE237_008339 [Protea cynaroides]
MGLWARMHTLQWSTHHGHNLILRKCEEFLSILREFTLLVTLEVLRDLIRLLGGAIPIASTAHDSAGPKMDIVLEEDGKQTGFLALHVEEYAVAILKLLGMPEAERFEMASAARKLGARFSEKRFYDDFKAAIHTVFSHTLR